MPKSSSVDILRRVPEGSRLSPIFFGIFVAYLIHELRVQFPNATITHRGVGGILDDDNLCLISTDARDLQMMINICQTWSEKAKMQLSADKTKVTCFHTSMKCAKTTTKSSWSQSLASVIPHSIHVPKPHQPHGEASPLPSIFIHTPTRGKAI